MDTSAGNTLDLTELNETELRALHEDKFGIPVGSVGAQRLIESLQSGVPIEDNPIAPLQAGLVRAICRYKEQTSWVPECHSLCFLCPDGAVMACYNDNEDIITEGDTRMTCLNPYDLTLTWDQIQADGGLKDILFMRQFMTKRGLMTIKNAHIMTLDEQLAAVKKYFKIDDGTQPEPEPEGAEAAEAVETPGVKKTKKASVDLSGLTNTLQGITEAITDLRGAVLRVELKLDFLATHLFLPNEAERVGTPFASASEKPKAQAAPQPPPQPEQPVAQPEARLETETMRKDDGY